jgi:hypothetical protein
MKGKFNNTFGKGITKMINNVFNTFGKSIKNKVYYYLNGR